MKNRNTIILILLTLVFSLNLQAQPSERLIKVSVAPDRSDWIYKTGENPKFNITVTRNSEPVKGIKIAWELGPEMMPAVKRDSATLKNGMTEISGYSMKEPGFLRCRVIALYQGKRYEGMASAAFDPQSIQPTIQYPSDFNQFWDKAKQELAAVPMDVKLTLLPDKCTENTNVYEANIQNYNKSRVFGILCVPKKQGKYPALLEVPGAGVRGYFGDISTSEEGIITFQIGIHGISVTMDPSVYAELGRSALNGYPFYNLDNRDSYYYKRVYLGCVRAIDFIFSLPEFDGSNLAVTGGSQGGALSIVSAGLDHRVKYISAFHPALCDLTGYLSDRAGGWPHMFRNKAEASSERMKTAQYYDVVNFARNVKIPGLYSWGYNDVTCPPTSTYSAYNMIPGPKELVLFQESGHWTFPEQVQLRTSWVIARLKGNK